MFLKECSIILLIFSLSQGEIFDAYLLYIQGDYSDALSLYKEIYRETPTERDALYGVVNSFAKMGKTEEALAWADTLLIYERDPIMLQKKGWAIALSGERRALSQQMKTESNYENLRDIRTGAAWGFLEAGYYRHALSQFNKLLKDIDSPDFMAGKRSALEGKRAEEGGGVHIWGGISNPTQQILFDTISGDDVLSYQNSIGALLGIQGEYRLRKHRFTGALSYYRSESKNRVMNQQGSDLFGISIDTLYWSLNGVEYSLHERREELKRDGYTLDTAVDFTADYPGFPGFNDTAYFYYRVDSLEFFDNEANYSRVDTVEWEVETFLGTLPINEITLYGHYGQEREKGRFGIGLLFVQNDLDAIGTAYHLRSNLEYDFSQFTLGGAVAYTVMSRRQLVQFHGELTYPIKIFDLNIATDITLLVSATEGYEVPNQQIYTTLSAIRFWNRVGGAVGFSVGEKAYTGESGGAVLSTISHPHSWTGRAEVSFQPFAERGIWLFLKANHSKYSLFNRTVLYGGGSFLW